MNNSPDIPRAKGSGARVRRPGPALVLAAVIFTILSGKAALFATDDASLADFLERPANDNGSGNAFPYRLFVPDGYDLPENAERSYPLVLFLHGKGEGQPYDNAKQVTGSGAPVLGLVTGDNRDNFPAFVVAPQIRSDAGVRWDGADTVAKTKQILDVLQAEYRIDPDKVSVTGLSLGGQGAWAQLQTFPDYYAAGIPIAWKNKMSNEGSPAILAQIPLWVFYGANDHYGAPSDPTEDVNRIRAAGGYVVYSLYHAGHGPGTWGTTGNNRGLYTPGLMPWLTSQQRGLANTQAPKIELSSPSTASSHTTANPVITIAGTASDAMGGGLNRTIQNVTWVNDRGGRGTAAGTTHWTVTCLELQSGTNHIQFLASDTQYTTFNLLFSVTLKTRKSH